MSYRRTQPSWNGRLSVWRRLRWRLTWMKFSRRRSGSTRRPWPAPPARWSPLSFLCRDRSQPFPCFQVKRKDAILTKCFHAFCYDCLRTRYETRWIFQRILGDQKTFVPDWMTPLITGRESVQSVTLHLGLQTITGAFDSINHFSVWFGKKIKATSKSCGTICSPQALPFMSDNNVKQKNRFSTLKCSSTEEFAVSCSFCIFECQQNLWKTCRALPALPRG